jgi:hypothetical protein
MNPYPPFPPPWRATLCLGAVLLAACSGGATGQGNAPKLLVLSLSGSSASQTSSLGSLRIYQCIPRRLAATLYFQDGSTGDFTTRVKWGSSNAGTVAVSNGDIAVPGGVGYYAAGTLVPVASGSAIITADYDGISAQTAVSVGTPQNLTLKMQQGGNYVVPDGGSFELGIGSKQNLQLTAWLDGVETDLSSYASWSLLSPNDSVATLSGAQISAVGAGATPLVPAATLPVCGLGTADDAAAQLSFTVHHIQGIAIEPEFSGNPQLIVGNSELMRVVATLDDGATQDLSGQSTLSSSDTAVAGVSGYTLTAAAAGGSIIGASFSGNGSTWTAPSIAVTAATASLQTVSICWTALNASFSACPASQDAATVTAGSLTPVQFHAVGTYDSGTLTQEITRQVSWSSSDGSVASIANGGLTAGQVLGLSASHTVTISGSDSSAQNVTSAQQQLSVQ